MNPLVSIIIPTYNRVTLLSKVLDAIKAQTYTNWECLLIDDGSDDATEKLVAGYTKNDSRFQFYKRPDTMPKGANACRNFGFQKSKGTYINWFDSDDWMLPQKIKVQLTQLENSEAPYSVCQTERFDAITNKSLGLRAEYITSHDPFNDYIQFKVFWTTGAVLWRRSFIEQQKLIWNELLQQSQDYDFHINALAINTSYATTDEVLLLLVRHSHNMSNAVLDSHDKVISNVTARYLALKNHSNLLSPASQKELISRMYHFFRATALAKKYKTSQTILQLLKKSALYLSDKHKLSAKALWRWQVGLWSLSVVGKGEKLLKFPK